MCAHDVTGFILREEFSVLLGSRFDFHDGKLYQELAARFTCVRCRYQLQYTSKSNVEDSTDLWTQVKENLSLCACVRKRVPLMFSFKKEKTHSATEECVSDK